MTDLSRARDHAEGIQFRARQWAKSGEAMTPKQLATELLSIGIALSNLINALDPPAKPYIRCLRCDGYGACCCPDKP